MEGFMNRLQRYSRRKCIEIADFLRSITNDDVVVDVMDIVACQRLGKTNSCY